jgi:hypothetical protein
MFGRAWAVGAPAGRGYVRKRTRFASSSSSGRESIPAGGSSWTRSIPNLETICVVPALDRAGEVSDPPDLVLVDLREV